MSTLMILNDLKPQK